MKHKTSKNEQQIYSCEICHYACSNKYNLKRHFSTTKHKMKQNETQNENKKSDTIFCCETCTKNFKSRTTLWRHKKNCCYSEIKSEGKKCVAAAIGKGGRIKAKKGSWITLAEYDSAGIIKCVKSAMIDGKELKADTWYMLKDEKFTETK